MKKFDVKVRSFVPVENEKDVKKAIYNTVKSGISFFEAKKIRREYSKSAWIIPYIPRLEVDYKQPEIKEKSYKPYKHHTKSNKKVVLS